MTSATESLINAIQDGLPVSPRPFAEVAERMGVDEREVIRRVRELTSEGAIRRFGVVVRHRELGYRANAMVVFDVRDDHVAEIAARLTANPAVTLCYKRPRRPPDWPYNLFCMIHGKDRQVVRAEITRLRRNADIFDLPFCVLFSRRCFKQRGARYCNGDTEMGAHG